MRASGAFRRPLLARSSRLGHGLREVRSERRGVLRTKEVEKEMPELGIGASAWGGDGHYWAGPSRTGLCVWDHGIGGHSLASDTTSPWYGGPLLAPTYYWASKSHEIPQITGSVLVNTQSSASDTTSPSFCGIKRKKKTRRPIITVYMLLGLVLP